MFFVFVNVGTYHVLIDMNYSFLYKRNFWWFRGDEFDPKDVKIIFQGGSTGNQRFTPEKLTIVGQLNQMFIDDNIDLIIFNSSTDGKSTVGYSNDFIYWFSKIPNFDPNYVIFYVGINDRYRGLDTEHYDYKISKKKLDKLKDYIKNNSFIVDKWKLI